MVLKMFMFGKDGLNQVDFSEDMNGMRECFRNSRRPYSRYRARKIIKSRFEALTYFNEIQN